MDRTPDRGKVGVALIFAVAGLCGGASPLAFAQVRISHGPVPHVTPAPKPPPVIVLKQPPGITVSRLDMDELQISALETEVRSLKTLVASQQQSISTLVGQLASQQNALQNTTASLSDLQTRFAHHTHHYGIDNPGGYSGGWGIFDLTQHDLGGRTIAVGLKYTCVPGTSGCAYTPPSTFTSVTSGPID